MGKISIEARQGVYLTYKNYPYTAAQVIGEYIDNAIQSAKDHSNELITMHDDYLLRVDISIDWYLDEKTKDVQAKSITIQDNAAGMSHDIFEHAFNLTDSSITRQGMNEFGIGMKAASAWLGNKWTIETTSIEDNTKRVLNVDLRYVANNQIKELDSFEYPYQKTHGTKITISELWNDNIIKRDQVQDLINNIASIYRYFIRNKEIQIYVGEELLSFEEYEILEAPSYLDPNGEIIKWRKNVYYDDHQGHSISGFIAILKDMCDSKRGVVFTKNHRVVLGFDPGDRIYGKVFIGQIGSAKYRRIFGELEITGIDVAFGKNKLNNSELLEALCRVCAGDLIINKTNLLTEASKYKKTKKTVKPKLPLVEQIKPEVENVPNTTPVPEIPVDVPVIMPVDDPVQKPTVESLINPKQSGISYNGQLPPYTLEIEGKTYTVLTQFDTTCKELFWNDCSKMEDNIIICKINNTHNIFANDDEISRRELLLIRALAISKFKTNLEYGTITDLINTFNDILLM